MCDANGENTPQTDNHQSVTLESYSPWISSLTRFGGFLFVTPCRNAIVPRRLVRPSLDLPPLLYCRGMRPSKAANWRPFFENARIADWGTDRIGTDCLNDVAMNEGIT